MYSSSTQKKFWTFESLEVLRTHRANSWARYGKEIEAGGLTPDQILSSSELQKLLDYYVCYVRDLCNQFQPPPPPSLFGTAVMYFKRFYLNTSPIEYHPKEVAYLCVYLAAKVDEYNVSINQFMQQLASNYDEVGDFVISNELLLMQKLHFHLTIHNPFRPLEGFLIDLKSRFRDVNDVEKYRQNAEMFIAKALLADTFLIYTPSQVALASLKASIGDLIVTYIKNILAAQGSDASKLLQKLNQIIDMVRVFKVPPKDVIDQLIAKLEVCRNEEHNPLSSLYRAKERFAHEQKERAKQERYEREREMYNASEMDGIELLAE